LETSRNISDISGPAKGCKRAAASILPPTSGNAASIKKPQRKRRKRERFTIHSTLLSLENAASTCPPGLLDRLAKTKDFHVSTVPTVPTTLIYF